MTDKMKIPAKSNNHRSPDSRWSVVLCAAVAALTVWTTAAFAQEAPPRARHFLDINTDRTPALTAFPTYPSVARRDRIEGEATVCFKIRADGKVSRAVVTDRSHRIFAKPALRAIKKSSFEPIGPGQAMATAKTCRIYRFRLDPILVSADTSPNND
jgi:protein TonB